MIRLFVKNSVSKIGCNKIYELKNDENLTIKNKPPKHNAHKSKIE